MNVEICHQTGSSGNLYKNDFEANFEAKNDLDHKCI